MRSCRRESHRVRPCPSSSALGGAVARGSDHSGRARRVSSAVTAELVALPFALVQRSMSKPLALRAARQLTRLISSPVQPTSASAGFSPGGLGPHATPRLAHAVESAYGAAVPPRPGCAMEPGSGVSTATRRIGSRLGPWNFGLPCALLGSCMTSCSRFAPFAKRPASPRSSVSRSLSGSPLIRRSSAWSTPPFRRPPRPRPRRPLLDFVRPDVPLP